MMTKGTVKNEDINVKSRSRIVASRAVIADMSSTTAPSAEEDIEDEERTRLVMTGTIHDPLSLKLVLRPMANGDASTGDGKAKEMSLSKANHLAEDRGGMGMMTMLL